jgi:hypothetical protein
VSKIATEAGRRLRNRTLGLRITDEDIIAIEAEARAQVLGDPRTRLVRVAPELFDTPFGTRTDDGRRLTVEWGEPDEFGVYEPVFTAHAELAPDFGLQELTRGVSGR